MRLVTALQFFLTATMFLLFAIIIYLALEPGYTESEIREKNAFIDRKLAEYKQPLHVRQNQALYEIWNLTAADVTAPGVFIR